MKLRGPAGRLLISIVSIALLGGCALGASPSAAPPSSTPPGTPSAAVAAPSSTVGPATVPTPTPPAVTVLYDIAFQSANPLSGPGTLDVYAPGGAGRWPVVVLLHGGPPITKDDYGEHARKVADLGFVVFVPTWGVGGDVAPTYDALLTAQSTSACAVAFAATHAAEYGGDPATMVVFGHSAGANMAALVAFARPAPTAGCLGGTTLGPISALVTWEGDWMAYDPRFPWDAALANDRRVLNGYTPLSYIARNKDLKVVMLASKDPGIERGMSDPGAVDAFFAVRDPSGVLRRQLDTNGALADGTLDVIELQQLLYSLLKAQGNPVSLDVMPDSSHEYIAGGGWEVFLAAFGKATRRD